MKFKAVCFDLDGTLLDSLTDISYCINKVLEKRGFPSHNLEKLRNLVVVDAIFM